MKKEYVKVKGEKNIVKRAGARKREKDNKKNT